MPFTLGQRREKVATVQPRKQKGFREIGSLLRKRF